MLDRESSWWKKNTIGIIVDIHSDRTVSIEYVQQNMKINETTFEITKAAKKNIVRRPVQALCLIAAKEECNEISIEPFNSDVTNEALEEANFGELNDEITSDNEDTRVANDPEADKRLKVNVENIEQNIIDI